MSVNGARAFSDRRFASVGGTLVATRVEGTLGNPTKVTFVDVKGIRRSTLDVDADWWPGQPVWTGMVHGKPVSVQVRAILNGYDLAYRGILMEIIFRRGKWKIKKV